MHRMTKSTFDIKTDSDGHEYVFKVLDELTKNHRESDKENCSEFMPEIPGSELCPVSSFIKYINRLQPQYSVISCGNDQKIVS